MEELENTGSLFNTSPKNSSIDPPKKKSVFDTSAKKAISSTTNLSSPVHGYNLGIGNSTFDEGLTYGTDIDENDIQGSLNEYRATNEPVIAKVGAGLGRVLTKATTEILKMPGVVGGLVMAPFAEEGEGFETAFNNQWIKTLNGINEDINTELLPVYVKKAVSEGNLWDNISSVDFWATEGADGIGFIASMLAPGAALKSLGLGSKILGSTAKGISMINGESKLAGATRLLTEAGITAEGIDLSATTMANTFFEAGSEAGSAMENFDKTKEEYVNRRSLEKFASLDRQRRSGEITDEQYNNLSAQVSTDIEQEFNQQKGALGRDIFLSNVAILLGPNAIQSKMIWGKSGARQLVNKAEPSLLRKVGNRAKNVIGATASEGFFEEAGQSTVENVFTNSANKGKLTDNFLNDFNVSELLDGYAETVSTTEGQKAIFLGGILGGGMSSYQGAKQDRSDRARTNALINLTEGRVNNFNTIYETDPYQRNEDGTIEQSPRTGQPIYDPVAVNKIGKALALTEQDNTLFEQAVKEGDEESVQAFKDKAINQLIIPFINQGDMGVDALKQYLKQSTNTEDIVSQNDAKAYEDLSKSIIEKANYLQTQYQSYRDFSADLVNLDEVENATNSDYTEFYNDLSDFHLNYKADEFTQRQKLKILNQSKASIINELNSNQSLLEDNTEFKEGVTEDLYRNKRVESDPRIKKINDQINKTKENLREIDETVNNFIWDQEQVNRAFKRRVAINDKIRKDASPENVDKANQDIDKINQATNKKEVDAVQASNPIVKQQAEAKKDQIDNTNMLAESIERQAAIDSELTGEQIPPELADNFSSLDFNNDDNSSTSEVVNKTEYKLLREDIENRRQNELDEFTKSLKYARKGDQGIYFTNFKGLRQSWEKDEEVTVKAVSKLGVLFEERAKNDWRNFNERWHNFRNLTRENEINTKYDLELSKLNNITPKVENSYQQLTATEGSESSDELIPEEGINNTVEELKSIDNSNIDNGRGAKVISTNKSTGEPFDFILEQFPGYIEFEREPVNKEGKEVGFEINMNPGNVSNEVKQALEMFNRGDFSNDKLIYDYLPLNVKFTDEVKAPIETKRKNGQIDKFTELLRIEVISRLLKGQPISNIKGSIQGQNKGILKIDNSQEGVAENNIMDLDAVKDINYVRNNLYVVNSQGQLQNIINDNTMSFMNPFTKDSTRTKENARGEIYLTIPQANGQIFPLKLNIKRVNEVEANIIYDIYNEILTNEQSLNTTLIEVSDQLRNNIVDNFLPELNIIGGNIQDITVGSLIDLMIYNNSTNIKSQIRIENETLWLGDQIITRDDISNSRDAVVNFLTTNKRHQIKIGPKSETDNTKTNLKSNSADYLKYLLDNKILNTNAVVNQPTFQGYTNIYINPSVSLKEDVKVIPNLKDKLSKVRTLDALNEAFSNLDNAQQGLYKQFFTDRKIEINNGINVDNIKVSEEGIELAPDNFTSLSFTEDNPILEDSGADFININNIDFSGNLDFHKDLDKNSRFYEIVKIYNGGTSYFNINATGENIREELENAGVNPELLFSYKDNFSGKLGNWFERGFKSMTGLSYEEFDNKYNPEKLNNLNNTRNSENNFVSLSEIPGTMENSEKVEVQEEVYEIPSDPRERNQDINRLISLSKRIQSGKELRPNELSDYNKFKNAYPQEFEKRCK